MSNSKTPLTTDSRGDRAAIRAHVEKNLGPIREAFAGGAPHGEHIEILHVAPQDTRPVHTLVTAGLSDAPMPSPGKNAPRYIELMMTLPRSWRLDERSRQEARWNWPIRQLASIAAMPRGEQRFLGWGDVVPNGEPPVAFAPGTKLCGVVIVPSLLVPEEFYELTIAAHTIAFFSLVPLYKEEMELSRAQGINPLFEKLIDAGIKDFVDPKRKNVARKRFGIF